MADKNYIFRDTFNSFIKNKFKKQEQYLLNAFFIKLNKDNNTNFNSIIFNGDMYTAEALYIKQEKKICISYDYFKAYSEFFDIYQKISKFHLDSSFLIYCFDLIYSYAKKHNIEVVYYFPNVWLKLIFSIQDSELDSEEYKSILEAKKIGLEEKFTALIQQLIGMELIVND